MSNIFARSPFFVSLSGTANQDTTVELFIWNGTGSAPTDPQYTLSKPIPSSVSTVVDYNISPYICEYFNFKTFQTNVNYNTAATTNVNQWCNVKTKTYIAGVLQATTTYRAFYGYSLFTEGYNEDLGTVHLDEGTYYYYYDPNGTISTTDRINAGSIQVISGTVNYTKYKWTNLDTAASLTTNFVSDSVRKCPRINPLYYGSRVKTEILDDTNTVLKTFYFYPVEECKYDVITIDFVNRYGSFERTFMFKASQEGFDVRNTEINTYPSAVAYDTSVGTKQTFNTNYNEYITCNTGWVDEAYISTLKQLMTSERILAYVKNDAGTYVQIPVKVRSKSMQKQKHINEKLINYKLEFDYAFDSLNIVQ
jgi:hypothetical protein